jgi:HemY protein
MIRVVAFLAVVAALALGVAWLADRPGDVAITWLGYRIETSVMVLIFAVATLTIVAILLWSLGRALFGTPRRVTTYLRERRAARGHLAITRGLVAIGAGDMRAARRFAGDARRLAPDEPLTLLLSAQAAQLAGNRSGAELTFRRMAERDDTKLLGLHGLYVEAQRANDAGAARAVAEEAVRADPALAWAAQAVLESRCAEGDWVGALAALDSNMKSGLTDKPSYRRQRAVLLTARALAGESREEARADVLEAVKLSPSLVPAAVLAARLLAEDGELRRAGRVIEAAWRANPHPDLAQAYAHLRYGDAARDRLARVQALARTHPDDLESKLAIARAAMEAQEFATARATLSSLLAAPTQRVAQLMAALEEADAGDVGRAREWMARALTAARDPAWTADGFVSDKWLPASPVTGRLDAFEWKVPVSDLNPPRVIEQSETAPVAAPSVHKTPAPAETRSAAEARVAAAASDMRAAAEATTVPLPPHAADEDAPEVDGPARERSARAQESREPRAKERERADQVIPLVHAPDDPGPEDELTADPAPEPPAPERWTWRDLFR